MLWQKECSFQSFVLPVCTSIWYCSGFHPDGKGLEGDSFPSKCCMLPSSASIDTCLRMQCKCRSLSHPPSDIWAPESEAAQQLAGLQLFLSSVSNRSGRQPCGGDSRSSCCEHSGGGLAWLRPGHCWSGCNECMEWQRKCEPSIGKAGRGKRTAVQQVYFVVAYEGCCVFFVPFSRVYDFPPTMAPKTRMVAFT